MRSTCTFWPMLLLFFSCNEKVAVKAKDDLRPKSIEAKGYVVPKDSMREPKIVIVDDKKLIRLRVGTPKVVPANLNLHTVIPQKAVAAGDPSIITPGTDTFPLPTIVKAIHRPILAGHQEPIPSLPLRMKDAANCNIQYLDVDQGMSSSYILSILQDKSGNLWFGTIGAGVSRYDGKSFTNYTNKEGLSSNTVFSILEDKYGNLWFGTNDGGVCKYDGKFFTHYTISEGLSGNTVWSILEDGAGNIWFGTNGGGVCKYDGKSFTNYGRKQGLGSNTVRAILEDKAGNLWFGTDGGGVSKFNGKSFTHYTNKEGMNNNTVLSILEDRSGNLWFGTNGGGVSKFNGKSFTHYTSKEGLSSNHVWSMYEDQSGNIWFGTIEGGVNKYNGKSFTHYTDKEGLSANTVRAILEDRSGNLWFGTNGGGVSKFDRRSFTHFTAKEGLSSSSVLCILEDHSGNLWLGTDGGGVNKYDGHSFTHYTAKDGLSNNTVLSVLEDKSGKFWFGTNGGGLSEYEPASGIFTHYTEKDGLSSNYVWSILEDRSGNLWLGTNGGGVSKFDGKSFTQYTTKQGLSNNNVLSILEDRSGKLWFATDGNGVSEYDPASGAFTHYTEKNGLSSNVVISILQDNSGNLWFGTNGGGLCKYDGNFFTHYTSEQGLNSNYVWSAAEHKFGAAAVGMWVSTENGISFFHYKENRYINFHREDGLKAEDFFQNSILQDSKNRIWWGSGKALSVLDMNEFKLNDAQPQIQLDNIFLRQNFLDFRNLKKENENTNDASDKNDLEKIKFSRVAPFHNYPEELELPYHLNHLTFNFSAIDWHAPHKIKYRYIMEGLDPGWSQLSADNKADYRNIPFGNYTFKVKAIGSANKWSKTFEYPFVIHPPWWRTWGAYSMYGLSGVIAIVMIIKRRERKLRAEKVILEQTIVERTKEVVAEKMIVEEQKHLIEEKHKEITDSINYAERIQKAFLATKVHLDANLSEYFLLFKPKGVVSGDFYWSATLANGNFILATSDSTGHGVPGAIMSLLNITSLEKAVETWVEPSDILNATRKIIIDRLKKDGSEQGGKDGMDCSLCVYDFKNMKLHIAAANNPVWIVRQSPAPIEKNGAAETASLTPGEGREDEAENTPGVVEIKADKMPVGKHDKMNVPFTQHAIDLKKGDVIYTLTDGFADQFGGERGKKFMSRNLRELLAANSHLPMNEQKELLEKTFKNWVRDLEQIDDVTVIGIRV